MVNFVTVA